MKINFIKSKKIIKNTNIANHIPNVINNNQKNIFSLNTQIKNIPLVGTNSFAMRYLTTAQNNLNINAKLQSIVSIKSAIPKKNILPIQNNSFAKQYFSSMQHKKNNPCAVTKINNTIIRKYGRDDSNDTEIILAVFFSIATATSCAYYAIDYGTIASTISFVVSGIVAFLVGITIIEMSGLIIILLLLFVLLGFNVSMFWKENK